MLVLVYGLQNKEYNFILQFNTKKMPSCELEVCDIEDAVKKDDLTPNDRITKRDAVLPKARARSAKNGCIESPVGDSIIPGTQRIYIKTWGCSHNNSDGEYMAGQLAAYGYKITGNLVVIMIIIMIMKKHLVIMTTF